MREIGKNVAKIRSKRTRSPGDRNPPHRAMPDTRGDPSRRASHSLHVRGPPRSRALARLRRRPLRDRLDRLPKPAFVAPPRCCGTSGATHTASPLATTACWPSMVSGDVSMEGLCAWPSVAHDDAHRCGVSPALRATHPAAGLCPHSAVWLSCQRVSDHAPCACPRLLRRAAPRKTTPAAAPAWHCPRCGAPGPRLDPFRASTGDRYCRLRYLMRAAPNASPSASASTW